MFYKKSIFILFLLIFSNHIFAGVINPDISVIGQFLSKYTDDTNSINSKKTTLSIGETEISFDSYLNPYSKGTFIFSINSEGIETEEAYINIFKGLPDGLALKGGKYRVGFGKLNQEHPHNYPFIEAPRVISAMLPGENGFNETGIEASYLLPTSEKISSLISIDYLNGNSFHQNEEKNTAAWFARWSNSFLFNEATPLELGVSATEGTNNVEVGTKSKVYGLDAKTKILISPITKITLQGEYFFNNSDISNENGISNNIKRDGFYIFTNLYFKQRWNAGAIYDQYKTLENIDLTNRAVKFFIGYSLMEETTILRLAYEKFIPDGKEIVQTITMQVIFSMGPHKAHQF